LTWDPWNVERWFLERRPERRVERKVQAMTPVRQAGRWRSAGCEIVSMVDVKKPPSMMNQISEQGDG
jgi:hypothetical protein